MRAIVTRARKFSGTLRVPGDKSISHRGVLFAAMSRGISRVSGLAPGADVRSSMSCMAQLGVTVRQVGEGAYELDSPGRDGWRRDAGELDCGNSGTTARLVMGMLAPVDGLVATLMGDPSLSKRPMRRVSKPLSAMGADIALTEQGTLPGTIRGRALHGTDLSLEVASAQVKTAVLLAGLGAEGETWVREPETSRDHTERLLPAFGATLMKGEKGVGVRSQPLTAASLEVPGDPSSAAFFAVAAAMIGGAEIRIDGVGTNPTRTGVVDVLRAMGARLELADEQPFAEPLGRWVCGPGDLRGTTIEGALVPRAIDEIPILAVLAAVTPGRTVIRDAAELRVKESDRIKLVADGLRAMGAVVEELPDGMIIEGGRPLHGARIEAGMDHRIAMSFAVAGLVADGETVIEGAEWADVSFPGFFRLLDQCSGGCVRVEG